MNQEEFQDYVVGKFKEWDKFINGNGTPGVKVRIDRLEQCHKTIGVIAKMLLIPITGGILTGLIFLAKNIIK